jgi:uncharacterized membrane protein YgcG
MSTIEKNYPEEPLDPQVEQWLETLRPTPPRDPEAAQQGRARFLAEMEAAGIEAEPAGWLPSILERLSFRKNHDKDEEGMNMQPRRFALTGLAVIILAAAILFGGAGITAVAAQGALPGDALYRVKTSLEETRLSLASDAGMRAQIRIGYAERRLEEISSLVAEGRYSEVGATAKQFETEINSAIAELGTISSGDPERAAAIAEQISAALARYAQTLTGMAASAPESVKPELSRALVTAQQAESLSRSGGEGEITGVVESMGAETWMVGGQEIAVTATTEIKDSIQVGDVVKVHLVRDSAGALVAREIELDQQGGDEGNANGNGNDNANLNENGNGNENINSNDDANENEVEEGNGNEDRGNANDDANVNENANDNDANENEAAEINGNDNGNGNDDDRNVNDNGGDDANGNTNTNDNGGINENANSNDDGGNANINDDSLSNGNANGNDDGGNANTNSDDGGGGGNDNGGGGSSGSGSHSGSGGNGNDSGGGSGNGGD